MLDVFVAALKLLSIEEDADANDAGLGFVYCVDRYGIVVEVYGFNQKLSVRVHSYDESLHFNLFLTKFFFSCFLKFY